MGEQSATDTMIQALRTLKAALRRLAIDSSIQGERTSSPVLYLTDLSLAVACRTDPATQHRQWCFWLGNRRLGCTDEPDAVTKEIHDSFFSHI